MSKFSYPSDWCEVKTIDVAKFFNGRAYSLHEWEQHGTPVIRLQNLTGSGETYYYSNLKLPNNQYCNKGDLLYMWSATFGPHIWQGDKAIYHYHIWKIECSDKIDKKFFFYELARFTEKVLVGASGSTMAHITKEGMEKRLLNLPPVAKQMKIAKVLSSIDTCISQTEETITKLQKIKTGLLNDLFKRGVDVNGKLRPSYQEKPDLYKSSPIGMIPKEWDCVELSNLAIVNDGTHFTPVYTEHGIPFLRVTDIVNIKNGFADLKYVSKEEHKILIKRCKPEKGDILYSKNGTIGIPKLIDWEFEFSIFVSLALIKIKSEKLVNTFLELQLDTFLIWEQIKRRAKQGTVTNLHLEEIREFQIALPSEEEQAKIVERTNVLKSMLENEEMTLLKFQTMKKGLMQDLLTGKVEVKVDNDE